MGGLAGLDRSKIGWIFEKRNLISSKKIIQSVSSKESVSHMNKNAKLQKRGEPGGLILSNRIFKR